MEQYLPFHNIGDAEFSNELSNDNQNYPLSFLTSLIFDSSSTVDRVSHTLDYL